MQLATTSGLNASGLNASGFDSGTMNVYSGPCAQLKYEFNIANCNCCKLTSKCDDLKSEYEANCP